MKDIGRRLRAVEVTPPDTAALASVASQRGLVDVAYATIDSPFGTWVAAVTANGLVRMSLRPTTEDIVTELAERLSPRVVEDASRLDEVRRQLDEYFEAKRSIFDLRVDWALVEGFNRRVLRATARIPYGSVSSYGTVAREAGSPRAARAAGNALHNNPVPIVVPCHRVIGSDGRLVGYGGGLPMKEALLRMEGAIL